MEITNIEDFIGTLKANIMQAVAAEDYADQFDAIAELIDMFEAIENCYVERRAFKEEADKYQKWWLEERQVTNELRKKLKDENG